MAAGGDRACPALLGAGEGPSRRGRSLLRSRVVRGLWGGRLNPVPVGVGPSERNRQGWVSRGSPALCGLRALGGSAALCCGSLREPVRLYRCGARPLLLGVR